MTAPRWAAADEETHDLLELVADVEHPTGSFEWGLFVDVVRDVARRHGGRVDPNHVREYLRGRVAPKRIGSFYYKAQTPSTGPLLRRTSDATTSGDRTGRNSGRLIPIYEWVGKPL